VQNANIRPLQDWQGKNSTFGLEFPLKPENPDRNIAESSFCYGLRGTSTAVNLKTENHPNCYCFALLVPIYYQAQLPSVG